MSAVGHRRLWSIAGAVMVLLGMAFVAMAPSTSGVRAQDSTPERTFPLQ